MSNESKRVLGSAISALVVAAVVGAMTSLAAAHYWRGQIDTTLDEHGRRLDGHGADIRQLQADADHDRESLSTIRADVAWIRGKLENTP